jgi:hypothetical protein
LSSPKTLVVATRCVNPAPDAADDVPIQGFIGSLKVCLDGNDFRGILTDRKK